MNESPKPAPSLPPNFARPVGRPPLENPESRSTLELILKSPLHARDRLGGGESSSREMLKVIACVVLALAAFGLVMGMFQGGASLWATPLKVSLGYLFSLLLCFPSLYIFLAIAGEDLSWKRVLALLVGQAGLVSLLVVGLLPVVWVFTVSTQSLGFIGSLFIGTWMCAAFAGWVYLRRCLKDRTQVKTEVVFFWWAILLLVTLQMSTTLRPLLGNADTFFPTEKRFFLDHWMRCLEQDSRSGWTGDPETRSGDSRMENPYR